MKICFDSIYVIIIIIVSILICYVVYSQQLQKNNNDLLKQNLCEYNIEFLKNQINKCNTLCKNDEQQIENNEKPHEIETKIQHNKCDLQQINRHNNYNKIRKIDYDVIYDPLIEPIKRPPINTIIDIINNPNFNIATKNNFDDNRLIGYLQCKDSDNNILPLYGKSDYYNHNLFSYYTEIILSSNKTIKIEIEQKKELFDGDDITLTNLNNKLYNVKLYKKNIFEYNPYI
jgi:hypothetical protein